MNIKVNDKEYSVASASAGRDGWTELNLTVMAVNVPTHWWESKARGVVVTSGNRLEIVQ